MPDLYTRPSREQIAARVNGQLPGAASDDDGLDDVVTRKKPQQDGDPLACFSTHLRARMRALGWDTAQLVERSGITQITITKAINGSGVSLEIAGKLAALVSSRLVEMIGPYTCGTCEGMPPSGFQCMECSTEGTRL